MSACIGRYLRNTFSPYKVRPAEVGFPNLPDFVGEASEQGDEICLMRAPEDLHHGGFESPTGTCQGDGGQDLQLDDILYDQAGDLVYA